MILQIILLPLVIIFIILLICKKIKNPEKYISTEPLQDIPKVINKIIIIDSGELPKMPLSPSELQDAHDSWRENNPEYKIVYWSLNDCRKYLIENFDIEYIETFDKLKANAFKCDFFRLVLINNEGGWYSDWKQLCLKNNLLNLLNENKKTNSVFYKDAYIGTLLLFKEMFYNRSFLIQNAFFGSVKNNIFLTNCIRKIIHIVKNESYEKTVLHITGPALLGNVYSKLKTSNNFIYGNVILKINKNNLKGVNSIFKDNNLGKIIQHKCDNCSLTQSWTNGNNYVSMYFKKQIYN